MKRYSRSVCGGKIAIWLPSIVPIIPGNPVFSKNLKIRNIKNEIYIYIYIGL